MCNRNDYEGGVVSLLKQDVYNFIKNHPNGVSVKEIYSNFTHIPQGTISNRLSNMVDEGLLERPKRGLQGERFLLLDQQI